jgi:hypothetical protein
MRLCLKGDQLSHFIDRFTVVDSCDKKGYTISKSKNNRTIYVEGKKFFAAQYAKRQRGLAMKPIN